MKPLSPLPDSSLEAAPLEGLVSIAGPLTVASVERWRLRIVDALAGSTEPGVDLAAVNEVDVFGLQLLLAARRGAQERGKVFRVLNDGSVVRRACVSAGVDPVAIGLRAFSETP
jgi:anti-anti-sigma regulatory factor